MSIFLDMFNNEFNLNYNDNIASALITENANQRFKFKLIYFEDRGRVDLIKLLFFLGKQSFEDVQIKYTEWNNFKAFMPFEQLPVLIVNDDFKLAQPNTICRFLANIFKLNGKNELERILIDMIIEQLRECSDHVYQIMSEMNQAKRSQMSNNFLADILPKTLEGYEKILSKNNSKYIVGDGLTLADVSLVVSWEWLDYSSRKIFNNYPLVKSHEIFIRTMPEISDWFKKQKPLTIQKNV